jgi:hypothetical protein
MTATADSLRTYQAIWQFNADLDWPELLAGIAQYASAPPGTAHSGMVATLAGTALATGAVRGHVLGPLVELAARDLAVLEREAATGLVGWSWMPLIDQLGVFAAMGAHGADALLPRAAGCLPSIRTARTDDPVVYYWNRGLAALALDLPAIYRPMGGMDLRSRLAFNAGARFELNLQGLLAHLAAAVEQQVGQPACEPAWHQVLANYPVLFRAHMLNAESLVWIAAILHHRVVGRALATAADYARDSVAAVVAAGG